MSAILTNSERESSQIDWEAMEPAEMLRALSEPGQQVKAAMYDAAELTGLRYWRIFDIWYRKARRVEQHEVEKIRDAWRDKRERAAREELHELKRRIERLEARLSQDSTMVYRPGAGSDGQGIGGGFLMGVAVATAPPGRLR
jgi:hypothetical protein